MIIHEKWNSNTIDGDYAVLILSANHNLGTHSKTIGLIDRAPKAGDKALLTGWGNTIGGQSSSPKQLQAGDFTIVDKQSCQQKWDASDYPGQVITDMMLCAENPSVSGCHVS